MTSTNTPRFAQVVADMREGKLSTVDAAKILGVSQATASRYKTGAIKRATVLLPRAEKSDPGFEHDASQVAAQDDVRTVEELIEQRRRVFELKRRADEAKTVDVRVTLPGPIGILHFGDPHVDDDGSDIDLLREHIALVNNTEGLFAANIGDTTNNWVGRLSHLWGQQSITAAESVRMLEWFVTSVDWLYLIGGNHDLWSGANDPLSWIQKQRKALYTPSECRLALNFPGTARKCHINARHDFSGHSMWNPAHGVGRAVQMGQWDDISVCGHKHVSGYMPLVAPDGRICHALQISSYKRYDRYSKEKGFRNQTIEPAVLTVINPHAEEPAAFVQVFLNVNEGVEFLKWKRRGL